MTNQKFDTIKLALTEIKQCDNSHYKSYDITVSLNDIAMTNTLFNSAKVVAASRYDFAEFHVFTCGCGDPGCAGYFTETVQLKTENSVKWTFPEEEYKLEKYEYEFSRLEFEAQFEALREKMLEIEKEGIYAVSSLRDEGSYIGYEVKENERYEIKETLEEDFDWHENRFESELNFRKTIEDNFPDLKDKEIYFEYEGKKSQAMNFDVLLRRGLNEWPSKKKETAYLNRVIKMGKLIEKMLEDGNPNKFFKKVYNVYSKVYGNGFEDLNVSSDTVIWWAFDYLLYNLTEEKTFKASNLKVVL